jgi:hypothetical protein
LDFLLFFTLVIDSDNGAAGVPPSLSFVSPSSLSTGIAGPVVDDPDFFRSSPSDS